MIEIFLFKRSSSKKVGKLSLNLGVLRDLLSINFGRFTESK